MAKKNISIRIPEEFLEHKPEGVGLSDWIRECIHFWILEQEGTREKILSGIDKAVKKIEKTKAEVKTEEINKVVSALRDLTYEIEDKLSELRNLEKLSKEIKAMKEQISKSLICKIDRYSYSGYSGGYYNYDEEDY